MIAPHQPFSALRFRQRRETTLIKRVNRVCPAQWQIKTVRRAGNLLEQRLVEMRLHNIALLVADIIRIAVRVRHPQQIAPGRADADGENFQPGFRRVLRRFECAGVVVLAVGEQHEHLVMIAFLEGGQCGVDGGGDGRAALRNRVHVQCLHALLKRRVVNRQRTFQKCVPGERDQPHSVRPGLLHQFQSGESGTREAVRRDVGRQHALGSVHRHNDVQSVLLDLLQIKSALRPGQRDNQQGNREHQTTEPDFFPRRRNADGQCRKQSRLNELLQQFLSLA